MSHLRSDWPKKSVLATPVGVEGQIESSKRQNLFLKNPKSWGKYNLLLRNCEHFAYYCKTKKNRAAQVWQIVPVIGGAIGAATSACQTHPDTDSETDPDNDSETDPDPEHDPELEPEPEPEPEPDTRIV